MALSRIELLKQKIKEEKTRKENGGGNFNSDIYPFWQMAIGDEARVRILPDLNEDNEFVFFVDRLEHKISINGEDKRIPCRSMHGEDCPICDLSRKYYKEEGKGSKNGKYYYRTKTSLVRVLVLEDPLDPNKDTGETFAGKVLNTQFGYQLMEKIKNEISKDDLGDFTDLNDGYDFIISKTAQGEYGTYSVGSGFARRPSAIAKDLQKSVELVDLSTLLPKDPGFEKVYNMLQAHLTGEEYVEEGKEPSAKPAAKKETAPARAPREEVVEDSEPVVRRQTRQPVKETVEDEPEQEQEEEVAAPVRRPAAKAEPEPAADEGGEEDDIIARLRARKNAAKK
jgi:hypothetical protein